MNATTSSTPDAGSVAATPTTTKVVSTEKDYWNSFYDSAAKNIIDSSPFAVFVADKLADRRDAMPIVEFGCGNARDTLYFGSLGFSVFASDLSKVAIESNRKKAQDRNVVASFDICDCTDDGSVGGLIQKTRNAGKKEQGGNEVNPNIAVYNRFFLHSIDAEQEKAFLSLLGKYLLPNDELYMEFRCDLDEALDKVYGKDHYRRYVKTSDLVVFLDSIGFDIKYNHTGQGLAKYKSEDPFVSRLIATKRG